MCTERNEWEDGEDAELGQPRGDGKGTQSDGLQSINDESEGGISALPNVIEEDIDELARCENFYDYECHGTPEHASCEGGIVHDGIVYSWDEQTRWNGNKQGWYWDGNLSNWRQQLRFSRVWNVVNETRPPTPVSQDAGDTE